MFGYRSRQLTRQIRKLERERDRLVQPEIEACGVAVFNDADLPCASGIWTRLDFNSERWDDAAFHSVVANTSRLTCPDGLDGWYSISGLVAIQNHAGGTFRQIGIKLNGVTYIGLQQAMFGAGFTSHPSVSTQYYLSDNGAGANDYVEIFVYQDSGVPLNARTLANYSPEFRMVRV